MAADPTVFAPDEGYPKTMSKGERLFNWLTYGGIAGIGVFLADIPFTYLFKYGKGAQWWKASAERLQKSGMSENAAEQILNTTLLGIPGTLAVAPVKLLENQKPKIVEKLNTMLGEKDEIDVVKEEPKQNWWSLFKSRIVAYGVVWGSFQGALTAFGGERFKHFEEKFSENFVCKPLGKPTHMGARLVENETKLFHYGKIAALNVYATTAAATLLYIGSRIFAKRDKTPAPPKLETAPPPADVKAKEAEECIPCRLKPFADAMSPSDGFAKTVSGEKAKAADAQSMQAI